MYVVAAIVKIRLFKLKIAYGFKILFGRYRSEIFKVFYKMRLVIKAGEVCGKIVVVLIERR